MRWPLRNQILFPFVSITVATIVAISLANVWLSTRRTKKEIESQLENVATTLAESDFPLTDAGLQRTKNLCGADLVVTTDSAEIIAASSKRLGSLPAIDTHQNLDELLLDRKLKIDDRQFFYASVALDRRLQGGELLHLHALYPVARWNAAREQAIYPSLIMGTIATIIVLVLSTVIARHVTRPVAELRSQVERIAEGDFQPMALPARRDEIRELATSVNQMADVLARYEDRVRQQERLKTMGQLGGGLVHQLRNASTGCRMALDLHQRECPRHDDEELGVATRQLSLIDKYLQQFLQRERSADRGPELISIQELVEIVLPLVTSHARHLDVTIECDLPSVPLTTKGHREDLEQVLVNLLINAIEATSAGETRFVGLNVTQLDDKTMRIEVLDSGLGPDHTLGERIFEPLVSTKPDGAGLGLAVAREITQDHGGQLTWDRNEQLTTFRVDLPMVAPTTTEAKYGEDSSRG
jgi:signal transduction histidine kinase